jgi:hypothetical protein
LPIQIDEDVASRVEKLGFDHNHLIDCLHRRDITKVCGSLDQFVHCCLVIVEVNCMQSEELRGQNIVSLLTNLEALFCDHI